MRLHPGQCIGPMWSCWHVIHQCLITSEIPSIFIHISKIVLARSMAHISLRMSPQTYAWGIEIEKNQVLQNVLAACSMNMEFLYILPGWEGSAANSRVFESAQSSDFIIPEGHYYLADTSYANSDLLLVPYRGVWYHLKEWSSGGNKWDPWLDFNWIELIIVQASKSPGTV